MRAFFALDLSPSEKLAIDSWRSRNLSGLLNLVPEANFHVTLAFLGEISAAQLDQLCRAVDEWLAQTTPAAATLQLNEVGYWAAPQVTWIGPREWPEGLTRLAQKLGQLGSSLGLRVEKKNYQPHVTLSRQGPPPPAALQTPDLTIRYDSFTLFESVKGRQTVHYHPLADWKLEGELRRPKPKRV